MMDIKGDWLLWSINFLIKRLKAVVSLRLQINQCVIDIFSKYSWVVPLKDKKGVSILNAFQKILKQSARKPHKIWVDKGFEFCNSHFKNWL